MTLGSDIFLHFLLGISLLLAAARGFGELARRLGQPSVIGELFAGVVLGPSLASSLVPGLGNALFPTSGSGSELIALIAQLGVVLLLLLIGLETDLDVVRDGARPAVLAAALGILIPFAGGLALATILPDSLVGTTGDRRVFALFVATAISMSAIPVIVKILIDLDLLRRNIGQLILAAGLVTDAAGWFILAQIAGVASAATSLVSIGELLAGSVLLTVGIFTIGARAIRWLLAWIDHHAEGEGKLLTAVVILGFAGAAMTQGLGLEAFLGAFLVGVQLARIPRVQRKARGPLEALTLGAFAPIFFANAGLRVDVRQVVTPQLLIVAILVIVVACLTKLIGAYVGGRLAGLPHATALALGAGMNARGAVEIIVATIGLQLGILTTASYSILVIMAVTTSAITPPFLRWALRRVPIDSNEAERFLRARLRADSILPGLVRVLAPVRDGRDAREAVGLVSYLGGEREVDVVALHARDVRTLDLRGWTEPAPRAMVPAALRSAPANRAYVQARSVLAADDAVAAILAEAERGYDLLVLGAPETSPERGVFGPVVDRLVAGAPCPTLVVRRGRLPFQLRRILVATNGAIDDVVAGDFAVSLAHGARAEVIACHVDERPLGLAELEDDRVAELLAGTSRRATRAIHEYGRVSGITVRSEVRSAVLESVADEIVRLANSPEDELILLSARRRLDGAELACGHVVEAVLRQAPGPVAVLFPHAARGVRHI
jgi:Kef-type K+ transport system membrane component KefB